MKTKDQILGLLHSHWGFSDFREGQEEIILNVCKGKDSLAVLATGSGKSICYQIPGLYMNRLTLVVSPLIALMQDQVNGLTKRGIKAKALYSGQSYSEQDIILDNAIYGHTQFLMVSPERLNTRLFKDRLDKLNIGLIAIDEAHCISEWGHDFRPEYRKISELRQHLKNVPIIALTATATNQVREDILHNLKMEDAKVFLQSPVRKNLSYFTYYTENKKEAVLNLLKKDDKTQLVYVSTRKASIDLTRYFSQGGHSAVAYHGGMLKKTKQKNAEDWFSNSKNTIVATKAFGMGIDKADVRKVIHFQLPDSLEAYVQESGRAGRDGKDAMAIIVCNDDDLHRHMDAVENYFPDEKFIISVYLKLCQYYDLATGAAVDEFLDFDMNTFIKEMDLPRFKTQNALKLLHKCELIFLSDPVLHPSTLFLKEYDVKFLMRNPRIAPRMKEFIKLVLRSYEGLFLGLTKIDEIFLAKKFEVKVDKTREALRWIDKEGLGQYKEQFDGYSIGFKGYRLKNEEIILDKHVYQNQKERFKRGIISIQQYILSKDCRQKYIAEYFGFNNVNKCRICDNCKKELNALTSSDSLKEKLFLILSQAPISLQNLLFNFGLEQHDQVVKLLQYYESEKDIIITGDMIQNNRAKA